MVEANPLIEGDTMEQRRVSFRVRDNDVCGGEDDFPEAPNPRRCRARLPASALSKTGAQIGRHHIRGPVADFEQTSANHAAWVRIGLHDLVPAREADLPAEWTLGVEPHRRP